MTGPPRQPGTISLRDPSAGDEAIVRRAHIAHRQAMFGSSGMPAEALRRFCEQQHEMQERHIAACHPRAEHRIILLDGVAVGRLCLDRSAAPWRLVDLAVVPEAQGRGVGTAAVRGLLDDAARAAVGVDLHVASDNARAEALYRRFGFEPAEGATGPYRRMVWSPPPEGARRTSEGDPDAVLPSRKRTTH